MSSDPVQAPAPLPVPGTAPAARARWFATLLEKISSLLVYVVLGVIIISIAAMRWEGRPLILGVCVLGVLTGGLLSTLLWVFAIALRMLADQADATSRLERLFSERLDALASQPSSMDPDRRAEHLAEIRHAIRNARWDDASALVLAFGDAHPDDREASRLAEELARARETAVQDLLARIEAARSVNDPDRVIELRDEVKPLLASDAVHTLDRDLARWFLVLIQRRLRAGTVRPDVAALAGRVAESLGETTEGASLRASLPTLRRAAGLCARCGQPYRGVADACPACLANLNGPTASPAVTFETAPEPVEQEDDFQDQPFPP